MEKTVQEIQAEISQQLRLVSESASLDAQVLLAHILDRPRSWILAHPEYLISEMQCQNIYLATTRLVDGEPLPYIIGHWEFYGLDFTLTPDVLIPRPETELLVESAIQWLQDNPHKRRVIDVGTGSGCIGISVAKHVRDARVLMTDISTSALNVAKANLEKHGLLDKVEIHYSDLMSQIPGLYAFDLICANLPYIPTKLLDSLPVANQEPRLALDGGTTGLRLIKILMNQATDRLDPGGLMLLEIDPSERDQVIQLAQEHFPSAGINILQDLAGRERCVQIETCRLIFHLCLHQDWIASLKRGNCQADSLSSEGFIHCSQRSQIVDVANRYYQGVSGMVILTIDPGKLDSRILWEKSDLEYYPHVYGPINLDAVCFVEQIVPEDDGVYRHYP